MEKMRIGKKIKEFSDILVCPACRVSLLKKGSFFYCRACQNRYESKEGILILLPINFELSEDFAFKKSQIGFFDKWSLIKKGPKSATTAFEKFFSAEVGNKRDDYSEKEMTKLLKGLWQNSWVLELGCGAGEHSEILARVRSDINLVMIDISLKSVMETKKRLREAKLKGNFYFLVADAENLPFRDDVFSGIIAVMFFHHLFSLERSFSEIKRTLLPKASCLVIDILSNNPVVGVSRMLFRHFPNIVKQRFIDDYVLENGEIPDVKIHSLKEFRKIITKSNLKIVKEIPYELFVSIFGALGVAFPWLKPLFREKILYFLYNIEKRMLENKFISSFAGARTLWLSR